MSGQFDLVAIGNPLLDMSVRDGEELLKKYNLKANDAILAGPEHMPIYKEIADGWKVTYIAGGASQNAARCAQYVLPANSTAYFGCVGEDDLANQLRAANDKEGLRSVYQVKKDVATGSCAVVITGHDRSLCTNLGAAEKFTKDHLESAEAQELIKKAKYFYMEGYFLTHGLESALVLAKHGKANGQPFAVNLSAPFIPQFFKDQVDQILPLSEIVFGNEAEAEAYAESHGLDTKDLEKIAQAIADSPSELSRPRTVIITHGAEPTIVAVAGGSKVKTIPTPKIDDIVDTNGAGDAFAGGVLGALIAGKSVDESITIGQKLGGMCIGQNGPILKFPKEQIF
ncbi:unnamed protein product [Parajaminaea phylloscopi]